MNRPVKAEPRRNAIPRIRNINAKFRKALRRWFKARGSFADERRQHTLNVRHMLATATHKQRGALRLALIAGAKKYEVRK